MKRLTCIYNSYILIAQSKGTKTMTVKERILQEVECAIAAVLGDNEEKEDEEEYQVSAGDINEIARKVKWYMDLD